MSCLCFHLWALSSGCHAIVLTIVLMQVFCLCRYSSCQYSRIKYRRYIHKNSSRSEPNKPAVHQSCLWLLPCGQCLDLLQSFWWFVQPSSKQEAKHAHMARTLTTEQVTLGLCLIGAVPFSRGGLVFISQMLGGMAAAGVVSALFPGPLAVTTSLSAGTTKTQGLFIEMVSNSTLDHLISCARI